MARFYFFRLEIYREIFNKNCGFSVSLCSICGWKPLCRYNCSVRVCECSTSKLFRFICILKLRPISGRFFRIPSKCKTKTGIAFLPGYEAVNGTNEELVVGVIAAKEQKFPFYFIWSSKAFTSTQETNNDTCPIRALLLLLRNNHATSCIFGEHLSLVSVFYIHRLRKRSPKT